MSEANVFNYSIKDGFLWSEVNLKGEKKYYIEGYASTIHEDKAGEIIDMSAQQDILAQVQDENITMDIEHEEWYDAKGTILARPKNEKIPVAKIVSAELRPQGVWVKAQLNTNLHSFNQVWGSIKDGFLKAFSIAFYPVQKAGNVIKHLNLVNVTLTGSPVNPHATFDVSMKSASAWLDSQEQLKAVKKTHIENPADMPKLSNPADTQPLSNPADTPELKNTEDNKMPEEEKKKLTPEEEEEEKKKKKHEASESKEKEEEEEEPETKCNAKVKAEEVPVIDVKAIHEAEIKALNDKYEAALKANSEEIAKLKAELEKPVMKAIVEEKMPAEKPAFNPVSPLQMIR